MSLGSIEHIDAWLSTQMSDSNRKSCVRVLKKLMSGQGVTHKAKPGEAFLAGHALSLNDEVVALRKDANLWLPCNGKDALDKGHGWALYHPLGWFNKYKQAHMIEVAASDVAEGDYEADFIRTPCEAA